MFKFTHDHDGVLVELTIENNDATWPEVLAEFQRFLAGCGYVFNSGLDMAEVVDEAHGGLLYEARNSSNSIRQEGEGYFEGDKQLLQDPS